jgi:hypothetical protein
MKTILPQRLFVRIAYDLDTDELKFGTFGFSPQFLLYLAWEFVYVEVLSDTQAYGFDDLSWTIDHVSWMSVNLMKRRLRKAL